MEGCIWVDKRENWLPRIIEVQCNVISVFKEGARKQYVAYWFISKSVLHPENLPELTRHLGWIPIPKEVSKDLATDFLGVRISHNSWNFHCSVRRRGVAGTSTHEYACTVLYWEVKYRFQRNREKSKSGMLSVPSPDQVSSLLGWY